MNRDQVKPLEGWLTIPEAMEILGMTHKQTMHKLLWDTEHTPFLLDDIRKVGDKPLFILNTLAVYEVKKIREREAKEKEELRQYNEELRRLKNKAVQPPLQFPF